MAAGLQFGDVCYLTPAEAGAHACSSLYGVTGSGVLACEGYAVSGSTVTLVLSNEQTFAHELQVCDRPTWSDTWAPIWGAVLVAAVSILCVRWVINVFRTGGEHA